MLDEHGQFPEKQLSRGASWTVMILFCLAILGAGLLSYRLVPDGPRKWDFGVVPDVPGESVYSTQTTPQTNAPARQFPMLPEADTSRGGTPTGVKSRGAASQPASMPGDRSREGRAK